MDMSVRGIDFASVSTIFDFGTVPTVWCWGFLGFFFVFFSFSMFLKSTVFFLITFDLIGLVFLFKRVLFLDT